MSELFEAAEEVAEELFPPKPGGLVDRHRQRKASEEAQITEEKNREERIEQRGYRATKVAPESPEVFSAITYTIAAGANAQILPLNPYRYRAIINLITTPASITLVKDSGAALGGIGFILNNVNPVLSIFSRGQLYALNTGGSPVQVSVLTESYAPET